MTFDSTTTWIYRVRLLDMASGEEISILTYADDPSRAGRGIIGDTCDHFATCRLVSVEALTSEEAEAVCRGMAEGIRKATQSHERCEAIA